MLCDCLYIRSTILFPTITAYSPYYIQVRAVWRDSLPVLRREAQFKLTDRTAHLFAKGTSSAVL